jgi:flagellar basal body rod protein FlgG
MEACLASAFKKQHSRFEPYVLQTIDTNVSDTQSRTKNAHQQLGVVVETSAEKVYAQHCQRRL